MALPGETDTYCPKTIQNQICNRFPFWLVTLHRDKSRQNSRVSCSCCSVTTAVQFRT